MKERLGALITELVVAAVRFERCNTRRHYFERLLFAHCGRPSRCARAATGASPRLSVDPYYVAGATLFLIVQPSNGGAIGAGRASEWMS